MNSEMNSFKKRLGFEWTRGSSGRTFLCPVGALENIEAPSEDQLRALCVEESLNPQND